MAQATIKSQMRSGLPLKEAMTAANRQLNEMSDSLALNALVGVLDGVRGTFAYVNAGQQSPLLMRSQDRYQWLRSDAYAPLGQSENVIYPVTELELHQGDRLFFHTAGLDKIQNGEGRAFGKERLVVALNESRSCQDDMERQLEYISSAGDAYADQTGEAGGYALLTLEYRRRDRAQAHCLLTADNAGSARLTEFLRCQLEANRLQPRQMAETLVLADELFALCRRQAAPDSRIMAECAIPGGEGRVILRLRGDMGGHSPLERQEGEAAVHAAEFITKNCDRVLFERDDNLDTVTVVKGLDGFQAAEGARK